MDINSFLSSCLNVTVHNHAQQWKEYDAGSEISSHDLG